MHNLFLRERLRLQDAKQNPLALSRTLEPGQPSAAVQCKTKSYSSSYSRQLSVRKYKSPFILRAALLAFRRSAAFPFSRKNKLTASPGRLLLLRLDFSALLCCADFCICFYFHVDRRVFFTAPIDQSSRRRGCTPCSSQYLEATRKYGLALQQRTDRIRVSSARTIP